MFKNKQFKTQQFIFKLNMEAMRIWKATEKWNRGLYLRLYEL